MTRRVSAIPGPSSRATTLNPWVAPFFIGRRMISPRPAYSTMLRETSEMAAAMSVASAVSKPSSKASARPFWRAVTMSSTDPIGSVEDIVTARQKGRALALGLGFDTADATLIAAAISEVSRNIVEYAGRGEIILRPMKNGATHGLSVVARDEGPGIADT